jgi:putative tricarboxylic transport membrane protein
VEDGSSPPAVAKRWHVLGFVLLVAAGAYAVAVALRLGLWRQNSPGEGLFPFLAAVSMTVFGLVGLAGVLRGQEASGQAAAADLRGTLLRVGAYLVGLVVYAGALDAFGFIVSTIVVVVFILRFAEGYSWRTTLALAVGTAAGCHVLFVRWLGAILPTGYLWDRFLY